jgi:hypothetical protein
MASAPVPSIPISDFVQVQLTAAGLAIAGTGPLTISNGRRTFTFTGTAQQKAELRYEWKSWLAQVRDGKGNPLFEVAPAVAATEGAEAAATPAPAASAAPAAPAAAKTT